MCATVSVDSVQRPTCAPSRAAAYAASQPAWPAPITMTSNASRHSLSELRCIHLPMQNREKMCAADRPASRRPVISSKRRARVLQIREHEFFRQRAAFGQRRGARARQRLVRALDQRDVTHVGDRRPVAQRLDVERRRRSPRAGRRGRRRSSPTPRTASGRRTTPRGRSVLFATISTLLSVGCEHRDRRVSGSRPIDDDAAPGRRPPCACRARATPSASTRSVGVAQARRCRRA